MAAPRKAARRITVERRYGRVAFLRNPDGSLSVRQDGRSYAPGTLGAVLSARRGPQ